MPLNWEPPVDGRESLQVRDLRGEDLGRLPSSSPFLGVRFLVEAGELLAAAGGGDVLVISAGDEVWAAAAAGYRAWFGDTHVVTARVRSRQDALRRLLVDIEGRSYRRHCLSVVSSVDVGDEPARRTFELLGYTVTGADVALWTERAERTGAGALERATDTWTLRKELSPAAASCQDADAS